jgi:hypothetical protein
MKNQDISERKAGLSFGYYTALSMTLISIVTFGIAAFTPPVSGPFCQGGCFEYPYTGIEVRFPGDYIWMYFAILLNVVFVLFSLSIQHLAPRERKISGQAGTAFALISAGMLITNYFLQVTVIQPSLLNGETDGIALLTQFNPHGLFIALEEIGFLMMSLAFLFLGLVLKGSSNLEKAIRWIFISGFFLGILSLVLISVAYGIRREYIFEVSVITINWTVLIVNGILVARLFRRALRALDPAIP